MGRSIDELIAYASDAAALVFGPEVAIAGNTLAATDAGVSGRGKDALGFGLSAATAGLAGPAGEAVRGVVDPIIQASPLDDAAANLASDLVAGAGAAVPSLASGALQPGLAKILGINQSAPPAGPVTSAAPTAKPVGAGGGAGPGVGGGGLDIQGGTAPQIYPYVKQPSGGSSQGSGQQQQARSI